MGVAVGVKGDVFIVGGEVCGAKEVGPPQDCDLAFRIDPTTMASERLSRMKKKKHLQAALPFYLDGNKKGRIFALSETGCELFQQETNTWKLL